MPFSSRHKKTNMLFGGSRNAGGSASTNTKELPSASSDGKYNAHPSKQWNSGGQHGNLASGSVHSEKEAYQGFAREYSMLSDDVSSIKHSKSDMSGLTLHRTAVQADYERGSELATRAAVQIVADKMEVVEIIAKFGIEPFEMVHLGKLEQNSSKLYSNQCYDNISMRFADCIWHVKEKILEKNHETVWKPNTLIHLLWFSVI